MLGEKISFAPHSYELGIKRAPDDFFTKRKLNPVYDNSIFPIYTYTLRQIIFLNVIFPGNFVKQPAETGKFI